MRNDGEFMYLEKDELQALIRNKLEKAGLAAEHAETVAEHLTYADSRGVHSHGAMRVEYYAERIAKGGTNAHPNMVFNRTGPCTGLYDGDNATGFVVAKNAMHEAISIAKENGVAIIGMRRMGHCGTLSYYLRMAAAEGLIGISMCQSDPMVVPYGGTTAFFGTNPIGFAAPIPGRPPVVFDMATTVGAWGKILDHRAKKEPIPDTWAIGSDGNPTTDPFDVRGLLPIAGAKGYGLMLMVDALSGILTGAPYGPHVSSMYADLSAGRELGQLHIVINPAFFGDPAQFAARMLSMVEELHGTKPAPGNNRGVMYPGESSDACAERYAASGIPVVRGIYEYLVGDAIHFDRYDRGNPFAIREE